MPYLSPFVSLTPSDLKDTLVRLPIFMMRRRPLGVANDKIRLNNNRSEIYNSKDKKDESQGADKHDKK
jgi:hypothetical protein